MERCCRLGAAAAVDGFRPVPAARMVVALALQVRSTTQRLQRRHRARRRAGRPAAAVGLRRRRPAAVKAAAVGEFGVARPPGCMAALNAGGCGWSVPPPRRAGATRRRAPVRLPRVGRGIVFVLFGWSRAGLHYVQAGRVTPAASPGGGHGAMACAILVANTCGNPTGRRSGKQTLAVRIGDGAADALQRWSPRLPGVLARADACRGRCGMLARSGGRKLRR